MELPFTHEPGRRERHLRRRHENPLFAWPPQSVSPEDLLAAQKADHDDLEAFRKTFKEIIQQAVDLPPDAGSDAVLSLKGGLEEHYEQSFSLPAAMHEERAALRRLIDLIMKALWRQAADDPVAHQELSDEETARGIHFGLLEHPLVADLLHGDSCIGPEELAPALLSSSDAEVEAACELFDGPQLAVLVDRSESLLDELADHGVETETAANRLALLRQRLEQYDLPSFKH
ncbi:hypothetical protein [Halochromatium glycolicum]|jgi:hypothetical protein|uniref:Uncharacterized protein n=1 Tax=Halochromatium glycolicum TaxID=85075 RepID=A0AAJ0XC11_9GAMM|nr:hypothetical protein [Halochromatium glycolicum]MBK1706745.1 hypothetical protein [Halochromatium glycolicum]